MSRNHLLTRRRFLQGTAAAAGAAGASKNVAAQEDGGKTVTVELTDFKFKGATDSPLTIPPGTTVKFVWKTGGHNIHVDSQPQKANWKGHEAIESAGFTYKHTFDVTGKYHFWCVPHKSLGMVGDIIVKEGGSGPSADGGGGGKKRPDFGGWLEGVNGGFTDARGKSEVTVKVGAQGNGGSFAFSPAGLWVDPGTTVKWEWTGKGGGHNVVAEEGPAALDSGAPVSESGVHYKYTFEKKGITTYFCRPHKSLGMKGAVAVGNGVPTVSVGGDGGNGGEGRKFPAPGGKLGFAFIVIAAGLPTITVLSVFVGEIFGTVRNQTDSPQSAYTTGIGAAILGILFILGIAVHLIL